MTHFRPALVLATFLAPLLFAGCGGPSSAQLLYDETAAQQFQLAEAGREYAETWLPLLDSEAVEPPATKAAFDRLKTTLAAVSKTSASLSGAGVPHGPELVAAHQKFLADQQTLFDSRIVPLQTLLLNTEALPDVQRETLNTILDQITSAEQTSLAPYLSVRTQFARENALTP